MFNIFSNSTIKLKELLSNGFVDIHNHILPGIDDGARDIEQSLELIKEMKNLGFSKIVATPHTYPSMYNNTVDSIKKSFRNLSKNSNINLDIDISSEYMVCDELLEMAENEKLLPLKENYLLIETNFISPPINFFEILYELQLKNYNLILAHPERYRFLMNDLKILKKLRDRDIKFQLNLLSLLGYYGKEILNFSSKLLKMGFIDFTGTDIHNIRQLNLIKKDGCIKTKEIKKIETAIKNNNLFK